MNYLYPIFSFGHCVVNAPTFNKRNGLNVACKTRGAFPIVLEQNVAKFSEYINTNTALTSVYCPVFRAFMRVFFSLFIGSVGNHICIESLIARERESNCELPFRSTGSRERKTEREKERKEKNTWIVPCPGSEGERQCPSDKSTNTHHVRILYSHIQMRQRRAVRHVFRDLDVVLASIKRRRLVIDVFNRYGGFGRRYCQFIVAGHAVNQLAGLHDQREHSR